MSVCEYADRSDGAVVLRSAASKDAEGSPFCPPDLLSCA